MNKNVLGPYSQKVNHNKSQSPLNWRGCGSGGGGGGGGGSGGGDSNRPVTT